MLLYVILLLIIVGGAVAFFVKKRGAEKNTAKPIAKKSVAKTKLVEGAIATKQKTTPLSYDLRNTIEGLIQEQNFFSAEAQINQALNRDNSQHELYLFLLEIHILQKDEFAISQLINHIQSLELDAILSQAEQKKAVYDAQTKAHINDSFEYHKDDVDIGYREPAAKPAVEETAETETEFDALMASPDNNLDHNALKFDFSAEKNTVQETPAPTAFEFESFNFDSPQLANTSVSETTLQAETEAEHMPTATEESLVPLDPVAQEPTLEVEALNLDVGSTEATATIETLDDPPHPPVADLDFSFSTATHIEAASTETEVEAAKIESSLDFDFSVAAETPTAKVSTITNEAAPNLDFNLAAVPLKKAEVSVEAINENDPLVKSFPELLHSNEIHLNLDLAQQYIQLGAYEAAREILADSEAKFSEEQQQQAQQLRNQIA